MAAYSSSGNHKVECDRCGFPMKGRDLQRECETKLLVCSACIDEPRPRDTHRVGGYVVRNPRPPYTPEYEPVVWDDPETTIYWGKP